MPIVVLARSITPESAENIAESWKLSNDEKSSLLFQVRHRDIPYTYDQLFAFVSMRRWTLQQAIDYLMVHERYAEYEKLRVVTFPDLPIDGNDLIYAGYKPGHLFSVILLDAWDAFIDSNYQLTKEELMKYVKQKHG